MAQATYERKDHHLLCTDCKGPFTSKSAGALRCKTCFKTHKLAGERRRWAEKQGRRNAVKTPPAGCGHCRAYGKTTTGQPHHQDWCPARSLA